MDPCSCSAFSKSFVVKKDHLEIAVKGITRVPSYLRPGRFPQTEDEEVLEQARQAAAGVKAGELDEAVQKSRRRRDKRESRVDDTFDEKCRWWMKEVCDTFGLPDNSEASFQLKMWNSQAALRMGVPVDVEPAAAAPTQGADEDEVPGAIDMGKLYMTRSVHKSGESIASGGGWQEHRKHRWLRVRP